MTDRLTASLTRPVTVRGLLLPAPLLVLLAAIGGALLVVVAVSFWPRFGDDHAYWLAARRLVEGRPLYDAAAVPGTPYAYWYPPVVAQLLVPVAVVLPATAFSVAWTAGMLVCLWWLAGRRVLHALALVAFLPVAVELAYRNVHLLVAVLVVLAITRSPRWWVAAIALQATPVIALLHLAASGRGRAVAWVLAVGGLLLVASVATSPDAWRDYAATVLGRAGGEIASFLPVPFPVRFAVGAGLALASGAVTRREIARGGSGRCGELLLVVALVLAQPTFWATALATAVAAPALQWVRERKRAKPSDSPAGA